MKHQKHGLAHYRQGDVMIERITALPKVGPEIPREGGRVILAHGDVTGHSHAIASKNCQLYQPADSSKESGITYLKVAGTTASLQHDEHSTIKLPTGSYKVTRQREYSPEEIRRVAD